MAISPTQYTDLYNAYEQRRQQQYANEAGNLKSNLDSQINSTNATYDSNARQAYVNYAKNQNALKEQLANQGINGGASESAMANMYNNYAQNVGNNLASQQSAIAGLQSTYNTNLANLQSEMNTDLNNQYMTQQQNALEQQQYNEEKALEQFQATIDRFTSIKSINKAIARLNKNDPNYLAKKQLLQLRRAELKAAKKKSSGGSSGGSSTLSGGSSGNKSNTDYGTGGTSWAETYVKHHGDAGKGVSGSSKKTGNSAYKRWSYYTNK